MLDGEAVSNETLAGNTSLLGLAWSAALAVAVHAGTHNIKLMIRFMIDRLAISKGGM